MSNSSLEQFIKKAPGKYNLYFDGKNLINNAPENVDCFDVFIRIMSDPVSRISSGRKTFELRKYVPLHTGLFFMFETDKKQAITGCFYCNNVIVKPKGELWEYVGESATKKEKFDRYFADKKFGVALEIADFQLFKHPITKPTMSDATNANKILVPATHPAQ
jgi:predicted transcriptional regulator